MEEEAREKWRGMMGATNPDSDVQNGEIESHTPGPWEVRRDGMDKVWLVNGYLHPHARAQRGVTTAGDVGLQRLYQGEREADARLIAAAPDLLAALERALPWLNGLCSMTGYDNLRWSREQVQDIYATRDVARSVLDALVPSGRKD